MEHTFRAGSAAGIDNMLPSLPDGHFSMFPSLMSSMIHPAIRARLPKVVSFRKRFSKNHRLTQLDGDNMNAQVSALSSSSSSPTASGSTTPPPEYQSTSMAVRQDNYVDTAAQGSSGSSTAVSRTVQSGPVFSEPDWSSGIGFKFASQGYNLLTRVAVETRAGQPASSEQGFSRQLYVDGVSYLIRGLPSDLQPHEQFAIRSSLPPSLAMPNLEAYPTSQHQMRRNPEQPPSALHKFLASVIFYTFLCCSYLLPYLQSIVAKSLEYENEHKLTERLVGLVKSSLGYGATRGYQLGENMFRMSDGRVGQVVAGGVQWVWIGVLGGVCQGFGDGLVILKEGKH